MAATVIHGRLGRVRITGSVATTSTNVAATLSSVDKMTLTIANTSRRHWSVSTMPRLYGATTGTELADAYTVDRVRGRIVFSTAHSTAVAYKVDIAWLPTSCLGMTKSWSLEVSNSLSDATVFSCSTSETAWREYVPGAGEATVQLGRLISSTETSSAPFFDRQILGSPLYVELMPNATAGEMFECYAYVQSDQNNRAVDNLAEENITLKVDGPVYFTTST